MKETNHFTLCVYSNKSLLHSRLRSPNSLPMAFSISHIKSTLDFTMKTFYREEIDKISFVIIMLRTLMKTSKANEDAQKMRLKAWYYHKPTENSSPDLRKRQMEASWLFVSNHIKFFVFLGAKARPKKTKFKCWILHKYYVIIFNIQHSNFVIIKIGWWYAEVIKLGVV